MKKKYFLIPLLLIAVVGVFVIQARTTLIEPSKKSTTKTFGYTNFNEIEASSAFDIEYIQSSGNTWSVEVSAPDNIMPYVVVKQNEDKISLSLKKGLSTRKEYTLKAKIVAPTLEEIDLSGASSFKSDKINVAGRSLDLEVSGASSINVKSIVSAGLEIDLSGASYLNVNNADAGDFDLDMSGASKTDISKLNATKGEIEVSGASNATLAGTIQYVELQASGASIINAKSLKADTGTLKASGASKINANINNVLQQIASGGSTIKNK